MQLFSRARTTVQGVIAAAAMLSITLSPASATGTLETLLELRNVDGMAQAYIDYVSKLPEAIPDFPQQHLADWRAASELAYDRKAIKTLVREAYASSLSLQSIDAMIAFMRSDLGAAVTAAEDAAEGYSTAEYESQAKALAKFEQEQPDRYALYEELIAVQYPLHSMPEIRKVLAALLGPILGSKAAEQYLNAAMPMIEDAAEPGMMILVKMIYDDFPEEDIKRVLTFSRSTAGREFYAVDRRIGVAIFQNGIGTLTTEFATRVSKK